MTIASIARVRQYGLGGLFWPRWGALILWLAVPLGSGWFSFALLDSVTNFAPQEIRLSADGEYDPYLDDFVVFFAAGEVAAQESADLYDPVALRHAQADELGVPADSIIQLPFFNPPAFALPLAGLSLMPMVMAAVVWTALQIAAFLLAAIALWRREANRKPVALGTLLLVATVSSMPFHETILHGQLSLLLLAGWVALWFGAFERHDDTLTVAGLMLLSIKPQLAIVPLVYLLFTRRWRALAITAVLQVLLAAVSSAALGPLVHWRWLMLLLEATRWEDENGIWIHAMFGWNAFVRALVGADHHLLRAIIAATLTAGTAAYCLTAGRARYRGERQPELFAMLVFAGVLMSPHLFAQDLVLCAAPLALLVLRREGREMAGWIAFGAAGWFLTFFHFDLLGPPETFGVNFVALWLAAGVAGAGCLVRMPASRQVPSRAPATAATKPPRLALQLALGALVAGVLLAALPGLAGQRMASAIEYSYSSLKGPTYRIVIIGLANE